jgi:hypothetical protein
MDLLTFNLVQRLKSDHFNNYLPERPVFAYYSAHTTGAGAVIDIFGEYARRAMTTWQRAGTVAIPGQPANLFIPSEVSSVLNWNGNASTYTISSVFTLSSGYTGLNAHSNTMLLNGMEITSEGVYGFNPGANEYATIGAMGIVLGETKDYQQGIDLLKYQDKIVVGYIGDQGLSQRTEDSLQWTQLAGLQRLAGSADIGWGDIGYNRKTNMLAFIESKADANYSYRLHIFKNLPAKIRADAAHLKALLEGAISNQNGSSYWTMDFTWPGINNVEWHHGTRLVPCDDGSFWLARQIAAGAGILGLHLARIRPDGSAYVFETVDYQAGGANLYGREQGGQYGTRHMVSDDQSIVALYGQFQNYFIGGLFYFVSRASAVGPKYRKFPYAGTAAGMSIAPQGGPNFILGYATSADNKFRDGALINLRTTPLDGTAITTNLFTNVLVSGFPGSTNVGGNGFVKIQSAPRNTTEWNERLAV